MAVQSERMGIGNAQPLEYAEAVVPPVVGGFPILRPLVLAGFELSDLEVTSLQLSTTVLDDVLLRTATPAVVETITELQEAVAEAYQTLHQRQAERYVAAVIDDLDVEECRDEVVAREDALAKALRRQESIKSGIVLKGAELLASEDFVRAAIDRGHAIVSDRHEVQPRDFAIKRIEESLREVSDALRSARPLSDEKDYLREHLKSLQEDHAVLISGEIEQAARDEVIKRVVAENDVDLEWLQAQNEELERTGRLRGFELEGLQPYSLSM